MRGEQLDPALAGFAGIYGDRIFAFHDAGAPAGFPYLTAREREQMLLFRPSFRDPQRAVKPDNQQEAEALSPGLTTVYADSADLMVDVETPDDRSLPIAPPALLHPLPHHPPHRPQPHLL